MGMTNEEKINAIRETADEIGGDVRSDYSGRGMYGKSCYGITCDNPTEAIEVGASKGLRGAMQDNMGRSYIVYWPSVVSNGEDDSGDVN